MKRPRKIVVVGVIALVVGIAVLSLRLMDTRGAISRALSISLPASADRFQLRRSNWYLGQFVGTGELAAVMYMSRRDVDGFISQFANPETEDLKDVSLDRLLAEHSFSGIGSMVARRAERALWIRDPAHQPLRICVYECDGQKVLVTLEAWRLD